jgi:hypothetical protein
MRGLRKSRTSSSLPKGGSAPWICPELDSYLYLAHLSVPAGVFYRSYFAFWVLVAIAWGFGAAIVSLLFSVEF